MSFRERLEVWQTKLQEEGGASYADIEYAIAGDKGLELEKADTLRKDKERIIKLLAMDNARLIDRKRNGIHYFSLDKPVDLIHIYYRQRANKPTRDIMNLLTRMHGFLPEDFLADLSDTYRDIIENDNGNVQIISFEKDCEIMAEMKFFSTIYKSINKNALQVTRHYVNSPNRQETLVFYPEFLKQYNSQWYVLGMATPQQDNEYPTLTRLCLPLIDNAKVLNKNEYPFVHSGIDYFDYFDEIVGVELDLNCPCETVRLAVSNKIFNHLQNNPLHSSQTRDKENDKPGFKGIRIEVRRNKELIRTIMNYGKDMEVISPAKLRNQIRRELAKSLELYL